MSRIYTRTGDKGQTGLTGGERVSKSSLRIAAVGSVDEVNASIGVVRLHSAEMKDVDSLLERIQNDLFNLGAMLASPANAGRAPVIAQDHILALEGEIDHFQADLEPLRNFILPGGSPLAANLHLARTTCRRAERTLVALAEESEVLEATVAYLNRLSDLLFVLARTANARLGVRELKWNPEGNE